MPIRDSKGRLPFDHAVIVVSVYGDERERNGFLAGIAVADLIVEMLTHRPGRKYRAEVRIAALAEIEAAMRRQGIAG